VCPRPASGLADDAGERRSGALDVKTGISPIFSARGRCYDIRLGGTMSAGEQWRRKQVFDAAMVRIRDQLVESREVLQRAIDDPDFCRAIHDIADAAAKALAGGKKLLLAGNGGSAGDAQHLAGEMLSRLNYDRAPAAAIALTTDSSVLTAIGNDYGYERVFERQILGLGCPGDVLIAISTSGRSPNILRAISAARERALTVVGFTGRTGGEMAAHCNLCLYVPSDSTPLIQQIHITAGHIICGLVEESLFPRASAPR